MLLKVAPGFLVMMLLISVKVQRTKQRGSRLSLACQVVGYVHLQPPRERDNFTEGTEYAFELRCWRSQLSTTLIKSLKAEGQMDRILDCSLLYF